MESIRNPGQVIFEEVGVILVIDNFFKTKNSRTFVSKTKKGLFKVTGVSQLHL